MLSPSGAVSRLHTSASWRTLGSSEMGDYCITAVWSSPGLWRRPATAWLGSTHSGEATAWTQGPTRRAKPWCTRPLSGASRAGSAASIVWCCSHSDKTAMNTAHGVDSRRGVHARRNRLRRLR